MPGLLRTSRRPKHRAGLLESLQTGQPHNFTSTECLANGLPAEHRASPLLKATARKTFERKQRKSAAHADRAPGSLDQEASLAASNSSLTSSASSPAKQPSWSSYRIPVNLQLDPEPGQDSPTAALEPLPALPEVEYSASKLRRKGFCNDHVLLPAPRVPSPQPEEPDPADVDPERTDALALRMLNLPMVVCNSCNGLPYFLPLHRVQHVVATQVIGEASMKEARRLKHKLLGTPLHMASCHSRTKHVGQWTKLRRRVSGMNPAQLSMLGKSGEAAGKASNGASPPGTRRTTGTFPRTSDNGASRARRASLTGPPQKGSPDRRKTHGSDDGAAARTFAKGRRASGMAQLGLAAADGADPVPPDSARLKTSFAVPESPKASQTPGAREASPKHARAQPDWGETFLQASADPNAGACQLDVREFADLQLHAATIRVEHEGGSVYEQKCRELGVAALSSVISSLEAEHANLSHCYLGARGAHALAHALACNVVIRNLTLVGNHMDGQAVGHVVRGLMAGAGNIHTLEYSEKARVQNRVHKLPTSVARTSSVVPAHDDMAKRLRERHERSTSCITQLNISENALGSVGARYVADLINPQVCRMQQITVLKLSKCELGDAGGTALANALADNNVTLVDLDLSKNGLGNGTAAAFGPLLVHNQTLERLDLSWNTIKAAGARELAKGLESNANLLYLCLAWNGLEDEGCIHVAQMFHRNVGLKEVDLSRTRMGPAACIVLAEALKDNTTLTHLMLHGNPLGEAGGWHIMSALSNNHYLEYVGLQGANFVGTDSENQGSSAVANFNPAHPEGSYTLDMGMPAERAIAVMLCNLDATSPGDLLKNIRVNGKPVSGGAKKLGWPEKLPVSGNVALDFTMVKHRREVAVIDKQRLKIFTSNLAKQRTSDNERLAMVSIFAPYNYFTCAQCDDVLRTFGMGDEKIMAALVFFARAVDHAAIDDLTSSFYERELQKFYAHLGILAAFRPENPTAHYELSLTLPHHRNIAQRLADVAAAEGEALTWRNLTWEDHGSHANAGPPDEWRGVIPNKGLLQFDYTTSVRVSPDARVLPDEELHQVLATDVGLDVTAAKPGVILPRRSPVGGTSRSSADSGFSPADTVLCNLRILSTKVCISVLQLKGILGAIKASQDRVEALVTLYPRLVDPDELWVALYSLKGLEQSLAMSRLGLKATFNPKRCSLHFQLDVSNPEHLEVAKKLVDMAMKVPDQRNFWNIRIFGKVKFIPENNTMWAVMTTGSFTPYLEFDFLGPDAFELMGFTDERVGNMQPSEKTDILGKYAAKLEDTRLKQMHPYYGLEQQEVGSAAYATQPLASVLSSPMEQLAPLDGHSTLRRSTTLTRPGQAPDAASQKTPWAAVWERNMRRLIGLDGSLVSPLHEIFNTYAEDQRRMSTEQLRAALLAHGHNKSEVGQAEALLQKLIEAAQDGSASIGEDAKAAASATLPANVPPASVALPGDGSSGSGLDAAAGQAEGRKQVGRVTRSGASTARDHGITYDQFEQIWLMDHAANMKTVVRTVQNLLGKTLQRGMLAVQSPRADPEMEAGDSTIAGLAQPPAA